MAQIWSRTTRPSGGPWWPVTSLTRVWPVTLTWRCSWHASIHRRLRTSSRKSSPSLETSAGYVWSGTSWRVSPSVTASSSTRRSVRWTEPGETPTSWWWTNMSSSWTSNKSGHSKAGFQGDSEEARGAKRNRVSWGLEAGIDLSGSPSIWHPWCPRTDQRIDGMRQVRGRKDKETKNQIGNMDGGGRGKATGIEGTIEVTTKRKETEAERETPTERKIEDTEILTEIENEPFHTRLSYSRFVFPHWFEFSLSKQSLRLVWGFSKDALNWLTLYCIFDQINAALESRRNFILTLTYLFLIEVNLVWNNLFENAVIIFKCLSIFILNKKTFPLKFQ